MRVSLFVTCLVDQLFPEVGVSLVRVLQRMGVTCDVPPSQTCCGQPAFNSGCPGEARVATAPLLRALDRAEYIVTPSGSCTAMLKRHLPSLWAPGSGEHAASLRIADRVSEFSGFLVNTLGVTDVGAYFPHRVTYHDSCHLLRDLHTRDEPRRLLRGVRGLEYVELAASDVCCGFGGTFAFKYPEISTAMGEDKVKAVAASGAEVLVANDTGCLMHVGGLLRRLGSPVRTMHLAQVLAQRHARG